MEKTTPKIARTEPGIDADDRLSFLPDEVISHILSFLQTKYAVGTTVLSRRWKDHWARVSNIDIDNHLVYKPLSRKMAILSLPQDEPLNYEGGRRDFEFWRFVDKVLAQHKNLNSVRRFRLHFSNWYREVLYHTRFDRELVFGPPIEEIDVSICVQTVDGAPDYMPCIPENFYTLKNLKAVKLHRVMMNAAKGSVSLPSVKILQLRYVTMKNFESLRRLISGCPVLETLHLDNCYPNRNEEDIIDVSLPSLKNLKICNYADEFESMMCPIVIEAPNLEELYLEQFTELQFKGSISLSCLHSVDVDFGFDCEAAYHDLVQLIGQISTAKKMRLSQSTLYRLSFCDDVKLLVFPKLIHLTIGMGGSSWLLHSLLKSASKLQSLVIDLDDHNGRPIEWESLETAPAPECLLSSLEVIEIKEPIEFEDDWKMVVYLVNTGAVLKKVNMHLKSSARETDREMVAFLDLESLLKQSRGPNRWEAHLFLPNNKVNRIYRDDEIYIGEELDDDFDEADDVTDADYNINVKTKMNSTTKRGDSEA
ncbi:unnamed protein product [Linum trigynum]|uniref:F-box domain-containing protein n=1 Tax=Linum trigynum TaxID=586398 RepID=A0AAV2EI49_9ROSI